MLSDYKGPANSRDIFPALVGERITAAFRAADGQVWIVLESGCAIVFGGDGGPSFWRASEKEVRHVVDQRRREIRARVAELRDMAGVTLDLDEADRA